MTVYFAGTERLDFETIGGSVFESVSTSTFNTSNSRASVQPGTSNTDDFSYLDCTFSAAASEFWFHCSVFVNTSVSSALPFIKALNSGTSYIRVRANSSSGDLLVQTWNGSAWVTKLTTATNALSTSTRHALDLHVKLGNPGTLALYVNGVPVAAEPGLDLSFGGSISNLDTVRLQSMASNAALYYSEVIIADWNTIGSKIVSKAPSGNSGTNTAWSGVFTDVDETSSGGTDYVTSNTADQRETYTFSAFPSLGSGESIAAVGVGIEAFRDASSPQNINICARVSSTDYDGADRSLDAALTYRQKIWETSPATGVAWTLTEANAAEFGVRSRA